MVVVAHDERVGVELQAGRQGTYSLATLNGR